MKLLSIYKVEESPIAYSATGKVFRGIDPQGRQVAIKEILPEYASDYEIRTRTEREVEMLQQLENDSIVKVYDQFPLGNNFYIVMEFVDGMNIEQYVQKHGAIPYERATRFMVKILEAMQFVHEKNFVHRDMKPSNIMIREDERVCILDFGIAKDLGFKGGNKTVLGTIIGSEGYMSPEQAGGFSIDHRADIYALGCVYYFMLTGQHAYDTLSSDFETRLNIANTAFPNLSKHSKKSFPLEIQNILDLATEKNMMKRYQSCREFRKDLKGLLNCPTTCVRIEAEESIIVKERYSHKPNTYIPILRKRSPIRSYLSIIFGKKRNVYSSIFASAEVTPKSHMLVQVYLHLYEETEKVKALAMESQKDAERRDYLPLQCKLNKGDKVDLRLSIYGETLLTSEKKSIIWQGSFTKCSFDYFVPKDIDVDELSCVALLSVNGVPVGEMRFITKIVDAPRQLNPEIIAHKYSKVFISYSHQDESKVKFLHEGLELGSVPHFFDRKYLKADDIFPQVIQDYINSADLFILCWSENASKSEYVQKERLQALERAFPQVQPEKAAKLRIYPMNIEPRAEFPGDMKNYYHFGEI